MYDTIIIGAGPAGMTAALYAARSNLKVALLERGIPGGQMNNTSDIENYPGYANISGPELAEKCLNRSKIWEWSICLALLKNRTPRSNKKVFTEDEIFETKTLIIATGAVHRHLGVPGEEELNSRGCLTVQSVTAPFSR